MSAIAELTNWRAGLEVRRLHEAHRDFSASDWGDGGGNDFPLSENNRIHAGEQIENPWAIMQLTGFYQSGEDLQLLPLFVYPGFCLDQWTVTPTKAPKSSVLWLQIQHRLGVAQYPADGAPALNGWSGQIVGTSANLAWDSLTSQRTNTIFPDTYTNSMPDGHMFVWHARIGHTDSEGKFTLTYGTADGIQFVGGMLSPPY